MPVIVNTYIHETTSTLIHIVQTTEVDFIALRTARDKILVAPRLLLPSVQTNIAAGELPSAETNSLSYFKIPVRWQ